MRCKEETIGRNKEKVNTGQDGRKEGGARQRLEQQEQLDGRKKERMTTETQMTSREIGGI